MKGYHPFWDTVHWVLIIAVIGLILRINATSFDETEIKSIAQIAIALGGLIAGRAWIANRQQKGEADG